MKPRWQYLIQLSTMHDKLCGLFISTIALASRAMAGLETLQSNLDLVVVNSTYNTSQLQQWQSHVPSCIKYLYVC